jgi:TIR domain-containing protein/NACHT domain-containing protein
MTAPDTLYDVFISYSHADATWVWDWLRPRLQAAGLHVCLDRRDFDVGVPSLVNMERAVDHSRHTLLVLTPAWVDSEWTAFEELLTQTADSAARRRRLIPLLLQPCQPPRRIAMLTYADFTQQAAWDTGLLRVIAAVQGELHLPELGPPLREQPAQSREQRNRSQMLEKVRLIWIKGFLEPSLDQLARIELGLETKPDAVERPFDLFVQRPQQAPQPLPTGTPTSHIFDEAGKALLILGEPGAGKTTLLLELARDLLDRAAKDESHPIPVVFNLSSWAERRVALAEWLIDELNKRYDVPRKLAKTSVDSGLILPLLDGLDEVAADRREACVEAINAFLSEHGLLPLVVCSRVEDYAAMTERLRLPSAVLIQPLSRQQIQHYIERAGASLAGLRTVLQEDETLWDLLHTPLMLSIASLAYKGRSADEIHAFGIREEHRAQLFAAYTDTQSCPICKQLI